VRKVVLAAALALPFGLGIVPLPLPPSGGSPGSAPPSVSPGYAPQATDFVYPVGNPRVAPTYDPAGGSGYQIGQMFDDSCDPAQGQGFYLAGQYFCGHTGVDLFDRSADDTVRATANGLVVYAGYDSSYGEMVRIQHLLPDGSYVYSQYEHMAMDSLLVGLNQIVMMGQSIGRVGGTGFVTGPHLHFEIKGANAGGPGYTFGNATLLAGYDAPLAFVAAHMVGPVPAPPAVPATQQAAQQVLALAATSAPTATPATAVTPTMPLTATAPVRATVSATAPLSATAPTSGTATGGGEAQTLMDDFTARYRDYVAVTAGEVNVRSGSGYGYAPLTSVQKGARLGFLDTTGDGWVHVALPGHVTGYVARQLVAGAALPTLPSVFMAPDPRLPTVVVTDAHYPARNGPLMRDMAVEPLWAGETLRYLGTESASPSWDRVLLPSGRVGWVLNWYLTGPSGGRAIGGGVTSAGAKPRSTSTSVGVRTKKTGFTLTDPFVATTVDNLNLRTGPRLSAPMIEMLSRGTKLHLRGYHVSWAAVVAADGAVGYVSRYYVRAVDDARAPRRAPRPRPSVARHTGPRPHLASAVTRQDRRGTAGGAGSGALGAAAGTTTAPHPVASIAQMLHLVVAVDAANLRAEPRPSAAVLGSAPRHTQLALLGAEGAWAHVRTPTGATAWILRALTSR
jgi:murein DD-endopeptidase MepM/ murein hydrolase activator NlpD/uncharacterized protein YraI